ncbi:hypothetical protein EJ03DRAFT_112373 [Teratosphaeria nubilosa]|uniref:DUF7732 domain-containing protein n=1 Tax=Teratosphaeria nubilosa TaxID=161662 RepID=A0A6G1L8S0_9PEZI|nr:hypothetical protein EJ03DRAFT_112373 [Teratosphaeria nubilosa]
MKLSGHTLLWLLAFTTTIQALALPDDIASSTRNLFKRKGGGGGGGKGGGSSSGGKGGSGSSDSSSSGSSSGSRSGTSNTGGTSKGDSGVTPSYGSGGRYYGGGASVPYTAGSTSRGGLAPVGLLGVGALAFFPGVWLYGAYAYSYPHPYTYHNNTSDRNETRPVKCLCQQYSECGCDSNNDTSYINSIANNDTVSRVANNTLYINGTLPNGTTAATSASPQSLRMQGVLEMSGWWVPVAIAGYTAWLL